MSDADGPYPFDAGVVALAHAETPVQESALEYVREAIAGDIDATVPRPAALGAHHVLRNHLGYSNREASTLLQSFLRASRIHWYEGLSESLVRDGLSRAGAVNVEGWDGYYAQVAIEEGVTTVLTIDEDLTRFEQFETEVILSAEEFGQLDRFLDDDSNPTAP
jgi:predicted nucleic acid-binding protein